MIADDMRLSRHLDALVRANVGVRGALAGSEHHDVPLRPAGAEVRRGHGADASDRSTTINHEILTRLENSGEAFLSNAVVDGKFALRACIVNFRTSLADIEGLLPLIARIGREVAQITPGSSS